VEKEAMEKPAGPLRLRPHHLLCLQRFVGEGYSEEFTANMWHIKETVENGGVSVKIVRGADDICSLCPHRDAKRNMCSREPFVSRLDEKVLGLLGIKWGYVYSGDELFSLARKRVPTVKGVCDGCEWQHLCLKVESRAGE